MKKQKGYTIIELIGALGFVAVCLVGVLVVAVLVKFLFT